MLGPSFGFGFTSDTSIAFARSCACSQIDPVSVRVRLEARGVRDASSVFFCALSFGWIGRFVGRETSGFVVVVAAVAAVVAVMRSFQRSCL